MFIPAWILIIILIAIIDYRTVVFLMVAAAGCFILWLVTGLTFYAIGEINFQPAIELAKAVIQVIIS